MQNCTNSGTPSLVYPNQTWTFPLNDIAIKVPNAQNMKETCIISSDFLFGPNILSFPSIFMRCQARFRL